MTADVTRNCSTTASLSSSQGLTGARPFWDVQKAIIFPKSFHALVTGFNFALLLCRKIISIFCFLKLSPFDTKLSWFSAGAHGGGQGGTQVCIWFSRTGHCEGHGVQGTGQDLDSSPASCHPAATQGFRKGTPGFRSAHHSQPPLWPQSTCPPHGFLALNTRIGLCLLPPPENLPTGPYLAAGSGLVSSPSRGSGWWAVCLGHGSCPVATGSFGWLLKSAGAAPM